MPTVEGFPGCEVRFAKDARPVDPAEVTGLFDLLGPGAVTDLLVFSHGWNNDMDEARALARSFLLRLREVLDGVALPALAGRRFAVLTVLWPSKRFADSDLIPGGAASVGPARVAAVQGRLDDLKGAFERGEADAVLEECQRLVPSLETSATARDEFVDKLRAVLPRPAGDNEDACKQFFSLPGREVLARLGAQGHSPPVPPHPGGGGAAVLGAPPPPAAGGAAGLGSALHSFLTGAENLLNYTTYYQMKERAGLIGAAGLAPLLGRVAGLKPAPKIHLAGHSFGGRLVTAAADASGAPAASMALLQAAFSHNGFASKFDGSHDGFFRGVVTARKVTGPVIITHTANDRAVGVAYPLASRIARQNASALGDATDPYGGIGRNGAQHTPEAVGGTLGGLTGAYAFEPGKLYNLRADTYISGHSDVCKPEVAYAVLAGIASA
jgi:hypothetical protein